MTQFTGEISKGAGRIIHLARVHDPNHEGPLLNTRQANHLAPQSSHEAKGNTPIFPTIHLHVLSGILEDISPQSSSSHRSAYSMSRFLDAGSEAPWAPDALREAHNKSRLTELSILSSNLLTIIGSPDQGSPARIASIPTASSKNAAESNTPSITRAWKVEIDALIRFLDPGSEAPWTPEDLGRRERVLENLWMTNELLYSDDEL
ncbi:hypothetical protein EV426DRAFT_350529 [Tirmania nivea]|nr:hypothetical protein EV426DRAFT_350529 [Tirmania nivea]